MPESTLTSTRSTAPTGDLDSAVCPVVLQVRFIQVVQEVVLWIVIIFGFLCKNKPVRRDETEIKPETFMRTNNWGLNELFWLGLMFPEAFLPHIHMVDNRTMTKAPLVPGVRLTCVHIKLN